jgi:putative endonuclease
MAEDKTETKRPTPISPARTLVNPGAIKASLTAEQAAKAGGRTRLGPGEIGKRTAAPAGETANSSAKSSAKVAAQSFGLSAESAAAAFLIAKGFRILARRWRSPYGEIDIVARNRSTLIFVEVKARAALDDAAYALTPRQRRRIADAASAWLAARPDLSGLDARFDVVLVAPRTLPRHIPAAFDIDG